MMLHYEHSPLDSNLLPYAKFDIKASAQNIEWSFLPSNVYPRGFSLLSLQAQVFNPSFSPILVYSIDNLLSLVGRARGTSSPLLYSGKDCLS